MKKIYFVMVALCLTLAGKAQTVLYSNTFDNGVADATIIGNGVIEDAVDAKFGKVFHNAATGQAIRTNYLQLPSTIFSDLQNSGSKELSIAFWVNVGTATNYWFTPLFSAYGAAPISNANTWPMMIFQSRLLAQSNCWGWNDFVAADNALATLNAQSVLVNNETTQWLDDAAWHYYTVTITETKVKVYIDGIVKNEWNCNGTDGHTVSGIFTNGSELDYICLGGNQAWTWADEDPAYMFDDVMIYSSALTQAQINATITAKLTSTAINESTKGESILVSETYFSITGENVGDEYENLPTGIYIKKATYENGVVKSTKIVKSY